jgi:hypothetical protein
LFIRSEGPPILDPNDVLASLSPPALFRFQPVKQLFDFGIHGASTLSNRPAERRDHLSSRRIKDRGSRQYKFAESLVPTLDAAAVFLAGWIEEASP